MHILRKKPVPGWVWRWKQKERRLQAILAHLQAMKGPITDGQLQYLGIEKHNLDLASGATCCKSSSYFLPATNRKYAIGSTVLDPNDSEDDDFTRARRSSKKDETRAKNKCGLTPVRRAKKLGKKRAAEKQEDGEKPQNQNDLHGSLSSAFFTYLDMAINGTAVERGWNNIPLNSFSKGSIKSHKGHQQFVLQRAVQVTGRRQCHQHIIMKSDAHTDENQLSVAELTVLVSWILAGMYPQKKKISNWRTRRELKSIHQTFPTLIISFQPRARARVLYGWFLDGRLHVAFTKAENFEVPEYPQMMDALLRWAWPKVVENTTRDTNLPTISERLDEDDESTESSLEM
ncbi:hypothetical protein NUU61_002360 [Penicillium alfredii]|uniref:Uncharacterized protein n=1 Tax=Penicillium alfredii TaxID=1506179 RepID=A0A9W9KGT5_9EURO|nr:uncharacterized protein NUU61_002360 [Penicillium alfredii]KAJ5105013.1 hypothetical protein NUU61_002360 [Penicillium alfredii]